MRYALSRLKQRISVSTKVQKHWYYQSLPGLVSGVIFWIVLLFFIAAAVEALGLEVISSLFGSLTVYLPRVLTVALIAFVGIVLGDFANSWVESVADLSGIVVATLLGRRLRFSSG